MASGVYTAQSAFLTSHHLPGSHFMQGLEAHLEIVGTSVRQILQLACQP
jgi:hypothetical protein